VFTNLASIIKDRSGKSKDSKFNGKTKLKIKEKKKQTNKQANTKTKKPR
jgi:hypothetical protein